jgi:hypothetical protein
MTDAMVFSRISFGSRPFRLLAEFIVAQNLFITVQARIRSVLIFYCTGIQVSDSSISGVSTEKEPSSYGIMGSEDGLQKKNGSVLLNSAIDKSHLRWC